MRKRGPPTRFGGPRGNTPNGAIGPAAVELVRGVREHLARAAATYVEAQSYAEEHEAPEDIAKRQLELLDESPGLRFLLEHLSKIDENGAARPETIIQKEDPATLALAMANLLQQGLDQGAIEGAGEEVEIDGAA